MKKPFQKGPIAIWIAETGIMIVSCLQKLQRLTNITSGDTAMDDLKEKVVIITGASEGIGRALAVEFAQKKSKLVLCARNENRLKELAAEVETLGAKAVVVPADLADKKACSSLIETAMESYGRIDVLVNNAGRTMWTPFEDIEDLSMFEKIMDLNYLAAVYCTYYALPHLKKSRGRIVGVASVAGLTGVPCRTAYAASKHAMFGFFDSLRVELKDSGVSVIMVAPDFVLSQIHKRALDGKGKPLGQSPLQESKIMTAEKCAQLIIRAVENRDRILITSLRGKIGRWLKLIAPSLIDNIAAKAIREAK